MIHASSRRTIFIATNNIDRPAAIDSDEPMAALSILRSARFRHIANLKRSKFRHLPTLERRCRQRVSHGLDDSPRLGIRWDTCGRISRVLRMTAEINRLDCVFDVLRLIVSHFRN